MNITENRNFDYQDYMKKKTPERDKIRRGKDERTKRREMAKTRITIRIDEDILHKFKELTPAGRGYQTLINQALKEWIDARSVKELIRKELPEILDKAVSSRSQR